MPLIKSGSRAAVSSNIREIMAAGHPQRQAVAAALHTADRYRRASGGDAIGSDEVAAQGHETPMQTLGRHINEYRDRAEYHRSVADEYDRSMRGDWMRDIANLIDPHYQPGNRESNNIIDLRDQPTLRSIWPSIWSNFRNNLHHVFGQQKYDYNRALLPGPIDGYPYYGSPMPPRASGGVASMLSQYYSR